MTKFPALTFQSTTFDIVDLDGQPWLQAPQIAAALGYSRPDEISRLYQRNADEFTESMTQTIEIVAEHHFDTPNGLSNGRTRIFSLRGCHLLAMFARTPVAKDFRKWALDILEREAQQAQRHPLPANVHPASLLPAFFQELPTLPKGNRASSSRERRELFIAMHNWIKTWGGHSTEDYTFAQAICARLAGVNEYKLIPFASLPALVKWLEEHTKEASTIEEHALPDAGDTLGVGS
ncbi:hypothetical protein LJC59_00930 [Desulfovibrio sp. OttesenSCG-928-A18]|nr:hypothetical protein [Desulfovibrio sp. OttesenSCG-928-A18]